MRSSWMEQQMEFNAIYCTTSESGKENSNPNSKIASTPLRNFCKCRKLTENISPSCEMETRLLVQENKREHSEITCAEYHQLVLNLREARLKKPAQGSMGHI